MPGTTSFFGTCDASFNATHDCKGITGWAYHLNGGAISFKARRQDLIALSSTESELIAVDECVRELRYLHKLLQDFNVQVSLPTIIGQDNMSTIALLKGSHFNARTRHVALRFHHAGEQQEAGVVRFEYLPTDIMPADVLTKGLARGPHRQHTLVLLGYRQLRWEATRGPQHKPEGV